MKSGVKGPILRLNTSSTAVLLWSGAMGWAIGLSARNVQVAVETSQVLAGAVVYPTQTAFFIYHVKLWTVLTQLGAGALRSGVSEYVLSTLLSGLTAQLSCQAIALAVFALCRNGYLALASIPVIFASRVYDYGAVYPILPFGSPHTYGAIGLSAATLVISLIATGWYRSGLLMLGLLPAIHPSLGFWTTLVGAASLIGLRREDLKPLLSVFRWYLAGACLTFASLGIHLASVPPLPEVPVEVASRHLRYFVAVWDGHRQPVGVFSAGLAINLTALIAAAAYLRFWRASVPSSALFLLRFVVAAAVTGVILAGLSHLPSATVPAWLLVAMPSRILNINILLFCPLIVGLLGIERRSPFGVSLLAVLWFGLLMAEYRVLGQKHSADVLAGWAEPFMVAIATALALLVCKSLPARIASGASRSRTSIVAPIAQIALGLTASCAVAILTVLCAGRARLSGELMRDFSNDSLLATAARRPGLLLAAAGHEFVQLRTRRPLLIDPGGINALPYALESSLLVDRVLRDAYGIEFFDPPPDARGLGFVPIGSGRAAWESFSPARWHSIRTTYGVTDVIAAPDWQLQLPTVAVSSTDRLFAIPE